MSTRPQSLQTKLLSKLLDSYERSACYGRPAPWSRQIIIKFDGRAFPEAFAPEGREQRTSLVHAARELESFGCVQVVEHTRGFLEGEPKEIRLGPDHIHRAYQEATKFGYEALALGLTEVEREAIRLASQSTTRWMRMFLEELAVGLRKSDPSRVGMSRERFKREWRDVFCALTAATILANGIAPAWERVVSERIFSDSKLFGKIRSQIISILLNADPRWEGVAPEKSGDSLEAYGVRRKPGFIRCAGAASLSIGSQIYHLEDFSPVAHLPDSWLEAWVQGVTYSRVRIITTVENEYPFLSYVEESGGPALLGASGELVIYTAGFPTPTLMSALSGVAAARQDICLRHWGDADVGGLRIWWLLRTRLRREVGLFRTTADWVKAEARRGGRLLSGVERGALSRLRSELRPLGAADVAAARELIDELLKLGIKLEQERY